ncbi:hypothetical protein GH865_00965 [Rhodocyclus tenuis]|uniref:hypothetical protein n=1 Tax=Rhodocyclus gracilis TaxID=2929842 RepID=UPI001298B9B4|nr:hypothetical protein [Rhodocyclus gracilis]MRD71827.1 hypothetical protein [Rhodocyclus gracilis]
MTEIVDITEISESSLLSEEPSLLSASATAVAPAHLAAAALAHLATHMQTRCPRSAALAVMLLERLAVDERADAHLRAHARQLADVLERDPLLENPVSDAQATRAEPRKPYGSRDSSRNEPYSPSPSPSHAAPLTTTEAVQ